MRHSSWSTVLVGATLAFLSASFALPADAAREDLLPFRITGTASTRFTGFPILDAALSWDGQETHTVEIIEPLTGVVLLEDSIVAPINIFEDHIILGGCVHDIDYQVLASKGPLNSNLYFSMIAEERLPLCGGFPTAFAFGTYLAWELRLAGVIA